MLHCQSQYEPSSQSSYLLVQANKQQENHDSYKKKIYKIQKRSDILRKSTIDVNNVDHFQSGNTLHTRSVQQQPLGMNAMHNISQIKKHHNQSVEECENYFEKIQNDRRKRTFKILKKFNASLASEVIYKESQQKLKLGKIDALQKKRESATICIQKYYRGFKARQEYEQLLLKQLLEEEERQRKENERIIEQWLIQQETARIQQQIDEKNRFYQYQLKRRENAAILIQRTIREYLRKKNKGISITQILDMQQLEEIKQQEQNCYQYQDIRRQRTPKSVEPTHRIGRGHIYNRLRQLQIETSGQQLLQNHQNVNASNTTPLGLSSELIMINNLNINQLSQSFVQSKTPNNLQSCIRQLGINDVDERIYSDDQEVQKSSSLFSFSDAMHYIYGAADSSTSPINSFQKQCFLGTNTDNNNGLQIHVINNQLDNSLNSLFDSLKRPPIHQNRFDLTQKINEDFNELKKHCESIQEIDQVKMRAQQHSVYKDQQNENNNLYNNYLKDEGIKDKILIQDNCHQQLKQQEKYKEDSLLKLIPGPIFCQDNTFSSGEGSYINENGSYKLQESDFPLTQLIKERTLKYNIIGNEEGNSSDEQENNKNIQNNEQYCLELGQRYQYFRELIQQFNSKEEKLRTLHSKKEELIKNIQFYQGLFNNFNTMLQKVVNNSITSKVNHKGKKKLIQKRLQSAQQSARGEREFKDIDNQQKKITKVVKKGIKQPQGLKVNEFKK